MDLPLLIDYDSPPSPTLIVDCPSPAAEPGPTHSILDRSNKFPNPVRDSSILFPNPVGLSHVIIGHDPNFVPEIADNRLDPSDPQLHTYTQLILSLRKSIRSKQPTGFLKDYHYSLLPYSSNNISTNYYIPPLYPLSNFLSYDNRAPTYNFLLLLYFFHT